MSVFIRNRRDFDAQFKETTGERNARLAAKRKVTETATLRTCGNCGVPMDFPGETLCWPCKTPDGE